MMMKRKCFELLFSFLKLLLLFHWRDRLFLLAGIACLFACLFVFFYIFLHCFFLIALVCGDGGSVFVMVMLLCLLHISIYVRYSLITNLNRKY